jgi:hypothetical protein
VGPLDRLLDPKLLHTEVVLERQDGVKEETRLPPGQSVDAFVGAAIAAGAHLVSVNPRRERLEDLFVREVEQSGSADAGATLAKQMPPRQGAASDGTATAEPRP